MRYRPIVSARINYSHPLASNLIFASDQDGAGSFTDLVSGTRGIPQSGAVSVISEFGRASKGNNSSTGTVRFAMPDSFRHFTATDFTVVVFGNHDSTQTSSSPLIGMSGNPNWIWLGINGSSRAGAVLDEGNTLGKKEIASVGGFQEYFNTPALWVLKRTGQTLEVSMDAGADKGTTTLSGQESMSNANLYFHGAPIGDAGDGTVYTAYIFNRSLTDAEQQSILDDPWALKRPVVPVFAFGAAAPPVGAPIPVFIQHYRNQGMM